MLSTSPTPQLSCQDYSCLAGPQMSSQDHTGKQNFCYDPCQDPNQDFFLPLDPVRIPAGKLCFPATFLISWQDPGRERDSWWDPAKKPFYKDLPSSFHMSSPLDYYTP